jgi:hypothetical protein
MHSYLDKKNYSYKKWVLQRLWKLTSRLVCCCIDVIFFRPKGHFVMNKYLYYWTWNLFIILLRYVWMKHPGHTYRGFVPAISERGMTSWPPVIIQPSCHTGLPHSPSSKPPWSRVVRFYKIVTKLLGLPGPINPTCGQYKSKIVHQGENDAVLNQHRWGLPPWNLRRAMPLSPPFPSKWSTFPYLPRPVTSTMHEHKHSLYSS